MLLCVDNSWESVHYGAAFRGGFPVVHWRESGQNQPVQVWGQCPVSSTTRAAASRDCSQARVPGKHAVYSDVTTLWAVCVCVCVTVCVCTNLPVVCVCVGSCGGAVESEQDTHDSTGEAHDTTHSDTVVPGPVHTTQEHHSTYSIRGYRWWGGACRDGYPCSRECIYWASKSYISNVCLSL